MNFEMLNIALSMGGRVNSKYLVCINVIISRKIESISQKNICRITNLYPHRFDFFNLQNNNDTKLFGSLNSSIHRQNSSLNCQCFKDLKSFYSSKPINRPSSGKQSDGKENDTSVPKKPKKEIKTYITLIGMDSSISVSTVEAAKKLADRRNFKLVKVTDFDPKSSRAVYKLMSESQYLREDLDDMKTKRDKTNKDEKLVSLSSNTNENDVFTKVNMIKKWLTKKLEVRVVITGDIKSGENIYSIIAREVESDGRIIQKRVKNGAIRFQILPPKKIESKVSEKVDKE